MSMNFNDNKSKPTQTPKKNNTKTIITLVIVGFMGVFGAIGIVQYIMSLQDSMEHIVISQPTPNNNLEQNLFIKCQKLQDWYQSLDGFENTNYHCDKYAKAWSGLVK